MFTGDWTGDEYWEVRSVREVHVYQVSMSSNHASSCRKVLQKEISSECRCQFRGFALYGFASVIKWIKKHVITVFKARVEEIFKNI